SDIQTRRDFYTPAELDAMAKGVPGELQQRYQAYTDGVNAWVQKAMLDPTKLPGEYPATGDQPTTFTTTDMIAIGVYLARTTPNGDGADLDNMRTVDQLGPDKFNQLLPLRIPGQISPVPAQAGPFQNVAWGLTSGLSQTNSLYAEKLAPGQSEQYVQNGGTKTMDCRDETFSYRSPPTDLLKPSAPSAGSQTYTLCRTDHGPVQARAG